MSGILRKLFGKKTPEKSLPQVQQEQDVRQPAREEDVPDVEKLGEQEDFEGLIQALSHREGRVQIGAAQELALRNPGDPRAVEAIIGVLRESRNPVAYYWPVRALGKLNDPRAFQVLLAVLRELGEGVYFSDAMFSKAKLAHEATVDALAGYGEMAVEPVKAFLQHKNESVRILAVYVLTKIRSGSAADGLVIACADEDSRIRHVSSDALRDFGTLAVPALIAGLKNTEIGGFARQALASQLGKLGDSRAVEPLSDLLRDEDKLLRAAAADALGELKDSKAVDPLVTSLEDSSPYVRAHAAQALVRLADAGATEPLIRFARSLHGGPDETALSGDPTGVLMGIGSWNIERLIACLRDDDDPSMRYYAAEALGKLADARAVGVLIGALRDPDEKVAAEAARSLGKSGDSRAIEPLFSSLKEAIKNDRRKLRGRAADAVKRLGRGDLLEKLLEEP